MEEVIGSLVVAVVVAKIPLEVLEEDLEVPMPEEEMEAEVHHHLQIQMVMLVYKTLVEVVVEWDL